MGLNDALFYGKHGKPSMPSTAENMFSQIRKKLPKSKHFYQKFIRLNILLFKNFHF